MIIERTRAGLLAAKERDELKEERMY